jgi:HAD superfamily hydrolase (TIGR01509 family)
MLGIEPPAGSWVMDDWYPDARSCLERLRADGYRVCACGNTPAFVEQELAPLVDAVASSESLGVWKPEPAFFERVAELAGAPAEMIAYVGDRVDNDVAPAIAAGMVGVHIRRGPWGHLQQPPPDAIRIRSLDELPEALL